MEERLTPCNVKTHWNSTHFMLAGAIEYRAVYNWLVRHDEAG
jgi:hypothetical protein